MTTHTQQDPIVILAGARTPMGAFQGKLNALKASELGAIAIKGALEKAAIEPDHITETIMGCVLPAGQGQAPARQAAINAGIPNSKPATTINKMCGSGMQAVIMGHAALHTQDAEYIIAGGMESMTNAPYIIPKMRAGQRLGHAQILDHMFIDGLEDAYDKGKLMGVFAENTAEKYQFTREQQDHFAIESLTRAKKANQDGSFKNEIIPVNLPKKRGAKETETMHQDEQPFIVNIDKIPALKPAFRENGTVTPANSSSISDGAAALILTRASQAEKMNQNPIARIVACAVHAHEPEWFTTAPVSAMQKLLNKTGWKPDEIDLFEVNEAFAVVTMAAMRDIGIEAEKVNVNGGACALGHPIGASGARIIVTLISALKKHGGKRGIASLCIGGGEATAIAIECL